MCTLAVLFRVHPAGPLIVAANRDEWLARPASPFGVLRAEPLTLGGKDELAGGTWLAVNRQGVVAALTNQPAARDPARRSRGELPLLLTREASARASVEAFVAAARCESWSPCWLLVGDRDALFHLAIEGEGPPRPVELGPGVHVLENAPLAPPSPKATRIAREVGEAAAVAPDGAGLLDRLALVLGSHATTSGGELRPEELEATCVHAGPYGTRSATLVLVPAGPDAPRVLSSEGPPCAHSFQPRDGLWTR